MTITKDLSLIAALLLIALVAGAVTSEMGWCLFVAAVLWGGLQWRQYRLVLAWTERPLSRPQDVSEAWFALAYRPYRALSRQRQRNRAIAERLREVLNLAQVMPDGVVIVSASNEVEGFNQAAKKLLKLKDSDSGLGLGNVVRSPGFVSFLRSSLREEPFEFAPPFDTKLTYEARRVSIDNGRSVVIVRDITALNRLLTMRQDFIANVSHELRTPLTVVTGYLEAMADERTPDELRLKLIDKLDRPMLRMRSLVDDLLLLSQLESTDATDQRVAIPVTSLMLSAIHEVQSLATSNEQILIHRDTNAHVMAYEKEMHSALVNLLSNALRYSPQGGQVSLDCEQIDKQHVRLSVRDQGIGIPAEHIHRITERFYRVDMAAVRGKSGTGLGLAIVKHVLRRHDSTLQVESTLGKGSLFWFDLEVKQDF